MLDRSATIVSALLLGLALGSPAIAQGGPGSPSPVFVLFDLGTLDGGTASVAAAINESGQIVGSSGTVSGELHAVLWEDGAIIDLGTLGGDHSEALGINESGQIVGWSQGAAGDRRAVLWQDGAIIDLGTLAGHVESIAGDINESGQIVGSSEGAAGVDRRAVLWQDGAIIDLGTLGGASAINDLGQVVGWGGGRSFLWDDGTIIDLGTLGGYAKAFDINNAGQVVGHSLNVSGSTVRAFLWDGTMIDLGTIAGGPFTTGQALGINNAGEIVGRSGFTTTGPHYLHATLWKDGAIIDLGTLGGSYSFAVDINDAGQIVGHSLPGPPAHNHAALWVPAEGVIVALTEDVQSLQAAGFLNAREANSLIRKLDRAVQMIEGGNNTAASNQLGRFIDELEALEATGQLTDAQVRPLLEIAEALIDALIP